MTPVSDSLVADFVVKEPATRTFSLDTEKNAIYGIVDGLEAMRQAVFMVLNTERYDYLIYSWNYGTELKDLFGRESSFVMPELKRRITEAIIQDSRAKEVKDFSFESSGNKVSVKFTVSTIFGEIEAETEVTI